MKFLKAHWLIISFLTIYFLSLAYKVIFHPTPFYDWDESLYIQSGKEMFSHNFFLFPVWQGQAWLDKPPLVPFLYALISNIFFFIPPEISTRLFTVIIATGVLKLIYHLYFKATKDTLISTLATMITAFTPIFLQRNQIVNLDIFLLLGWLGYITFFKNFWISLLFLAISVFSKSLIGFYPIAIMGIYYSYQLFTKSINTKEFTKVVKQLVIHTSILLMWFVIMFMIYGQAFWYQHIIESHFKRVTSSIEFHFGQRTFYLDLARDQLGIFIWPAIIGFIVFVGQSIIDLRKKTLNAEKTLYSLYLLPWFLFLNLTKTKIFWYFYSAVPLFGFLAAYPLTLFKKNKFIFYGLGIVFMVFILYKGFIADRFFTTFYSKQEAYLDLAQYAHNKCNQLYYLQNADTRKSFEELDKLGLLITTTKWWGDHPSMFYYFGRPIHFIYDVDEMKQALNTAHQHDCFVMDTKDIALAGNFALLKQFDTYYLFSKPNVDSTIY